MTTYTELTRITICDNPDTPDARKFELYAVDADEAMDRDDATGSILGKTTKSGRKKIYIPAAEQPDFDEEGHSIIASTDEEVFAAGTVRSPGELTKGGANARAYRVKSDA